MTDSYPSVRLAAAQAAPVFLDRDATVAKACRLIAEAGEGGARLVVFPEGFVPGFPDWFNFFLPRSPESIRFSRELFKNAVEVPGPATEQLCRAARQARTHVVIGINERDPGSMGSLFNSLLFIGPEGNILGVHRKIVPTGWERLVHGYGDGGSLRVYASPFGAIGGLICGENTNSLARFALLAQHERVHATSWPAFVLASQQRGALEAIHVRNRYHALEGRVYVVSAVGVMSDEYLDCIGVSAEQRAQLGSRGGQSGIVGPSGAYIAGPVDDSEQIVYADADMEKILDGKLLNDATGHYNRPDLFTLILRQAPRRLLEVRESEPIAGVELSPKNEGG